MSLQQGMTFEVTHRVGDEVTAHHLGNEGFHVLATPIIVAWFEEAARTLAALHLSLGWGPSAPWSPRSTSPPRQSG
ncbi:MAG: hypothetical protein HW385_1651 [candidate division NC10 bacterium]|nr:hypothetical protein [candidate division NC10 bacterium]